MFSAGADMKERPIRTHPGEYWHFNRLARECFNAIAECAKPVIAAVNGPALGAGLGLAAACDIILCSENAQLGMPEIDVGLAGGAAMLQTLFGRSRARRMFYTGWRVPAEELYRTGVVGMLRAAGPADAGGDEARRPRSPRRARSACAMPSSR